MGRGVLRFAVATVAATAAVGGALGSPAAGQQMAPPGRGGEDIGPRLMMQGKWRMDEIRTGPRGAKTTPNAVIGSPAGKLDAKTSVTRTDPVAAFGPAALRFPGWRDGADPERVHPTQSSVRVPHRASFVPGHTKRFRVTVFIRPANTQAPRSPINQNDTGNIAQKGFADDPDGQWKMSLYGDMTPICSFRGDNDNNNTTPTVRRNVRASQALQPQEAYRIQCTLTPDLVRLRVHRVTNRGTLVPVTNKANNTPPPDVFVINNDARVWFGKKPGDPTASNTFTGAMDNVTIERLAM